MVFFRSFYHLLSFFYAFSWYVDGCIVIVYDDQHPSPEQLLGLLLYYFSYFLVLFLLSTIKYVL